MSPDGGDKPTGDLAQRDRRRLRLVRQVHRPLHRRRLGVQGSGWAVLACDSIGQHLIIFQLFDQQGNFPAGTVPLLHARRLGARLLPRLQERARRLRQGVLEHRQLGERQASASPPRAKRPTGLLVLS